MNTKITSYLLPSLLLATAIAVHAEEKKEVVIRRLDKEPGHIRVVVNRDDGKSEKETVTYLGVETSPAGRTLGAQLGLPRDHGLVVVRVADGSPAAAVLQPDDVLVKFEDQQLVDTRQLSVLVRGKKQGDEVALTVFRGGKQMSVKAKLGQREVPKGGGEVDVMRIFEGDGMHGLPGARREDIGEIMRMIGREKGNWFQAPRMHIIRRSVGKGSTLLDMPKGNFVYSDDEGSVEINSHDGKRELTVKNAKGEETFKGSISGEDDRKKLPPEVVARLKKIEAIDVDTEPGEDFEQEATAVEPPSKTKTRHQTLHRLPPPERPY